MKKLTLLGATGSIGKSTLDLVSRHPQGYSIYALTANTSIQRMAALCVEHKPEYAVMADAESAKQLERILADSQTQVAYGKQALDAACEQADVDIVVAAIVGAVGLMPTLAAVRAGKRVLLANKESLVMAGSLFMSEVIAHGAELLPIDSEHNAIFQCLPAGYRMGSKPPGVNKVLLTGSGGPFRDLPMCDFEAVLPRQAIAHPNWDMGPKVSVDSATMMNKGLELIEACWLFDLDEAEIDIVLHKQSIIHSLVAYNDGSVLAQMGSPDMRTSIANALAWPERIDSGVEPLDLIRIAELNFEAVDNARFPCLALARTAFRQGGTSTAILNAANEVGVESFLAGRIKFTEIVQLIDKTLNHIVSRNTDDLGTLLHEDALARQYARQQVKQIAG